MQSSLEKQIGLTLHTVLPSMAHHTRLHTSSSLCGEGFVIVQSTWLPFSRILYQTLLVMHIFVLVV